MTTMMKKGILAAILTLSLLVGTVAYAATQESTAARAAAPSITLAEKGKPQSRGVTLQVAGIAHEVQPGDAAMNLQVSGLLTNRTKEAIDLREVKFVLRDESGKLAIPARVDAGGETVLRPGQAIDMHLTIDSIGHDALGSPLRLVMVTPSGEASLALVIEVGCSWPPLKCWIKVKVDL